MDMISKFSIYILLVSSTWDCTLQKPMKIPNVALLKAEYLQNLKTAYDVKNMEQEYSLRLQRQVVQPKWLSGLDIKRPVDPRVHVTKESLAEAEAIRTAIQKKIDTNTFAVNPNQPSPPSKTIILSPVSPTNSKSAENSASETNAGPTESPQHPAFPMDFKSFEQSFQSFPTLQPETEIDWKPIWLKFVKQWKKMFKGKWEWEWHWDFM